MNSEAVSVSGLFEIHGTAVVPTVSVVAPEKLSASTRRRYETQVRGRVSRFPNVSHKRGRKLELNIFNMSVRGTTDTWERQTAVSASRKWSLKD